MSEKTEWTRTFGELKKWVLKTANVPDHFQLHKLGMAHHKFWHHLNHVEYQRGYVPGEYEKPDTPPLYMMRLLTEAEFEKYQAEYRNILETR